MSIFLKTLAAGLILLAGISLEAQTVFPQPGSNIYLDGSHILVGSITATVLGTNAPGTAGYVLTTDGSNFVYWANVTSIGGATLAGNNVFTGVNTFGVLKLTSLTNSAGSANTVAIYDANTPPRLIFLANATGILHNNGSGGFTYSAVNLAGADVTGVLAAAGFPALTGDVTTTAGALGTTLATVNSGPGTYGSASSVAQVTVNGKGLVTAGSSVAIAIYPTNFTFGTDQVSSQATNFILNCAGAIYQKIICTNNVNFQYVTNGPGSLSVKLWPNGSDRTLTFPTNWTFLTTNNLILSGSLWSYTLTNAATGNGARVGWLSVVLDDATSSQTNVVANFVESP